MRRINFILYFISIYSVLSSNISVASENESNFDYTFGVCFLVENQPVSLTNAKNGISPIILTWNHLTKNIKVPPESITVDMYNNATLNIIKKPEHGNLALTESQRGAVYIPSDKNFYGVDHSTILVNLGEYRAKLLYSFKVMGQVEDSTEEYDPYKDKNNCPKGRIWKM